MKKKMSESEIQQRIQIEGPHYGCFLMRNNSGAFKDKDGRLVRFGLGNISNLSMKSSDLIGITTIVVTPQMVGRTIGIFTSIEAKEEGWQLPTNPREISQAQYIDWVKLKGGIAGFATSVDEFKQLMKL